MAKGWGCCKRGKTTKKFASGGFVGPAGTNRGSWSGDGDSLGVKTGTVTGTSATNRTEKGEDSNAKKAIKAPFKPLKAAPPAVKPPGLKAKPAGMSSPLRKEKLAYEDMGAMFKREGTGTNWPGQGRTAPPSPREKLAYEDMGAMFKREGTGTNWPGQGRGTSGKSNREK